VNSCDAVFQENRAGRVYDGFAAERRLRQLLQGSCVGFDKPGLLLHSACPLIKPSLQSAVGSCSWLDGLILFAPDLPVALF